MMQFAKMLGATHVAIGVPYDNGDQWDKWVDAAHNNGLSVIGRSHWNSQEGDNGAPDNLTPGQYITNTDGFLNTHKSHLKPGDVFIYCVEPEQGHYWSRTYGSNWSGNATAMAEYNKFIQDGINHGKQILSSIGGIDTSLVSVNGDMLMLLSQDTVNLMTAVAVDHYTENENNGPKHTYDLKYMHDKMVADLDRFYNKWHKPIYIGEWGFTINSDEVSDDWQKTVYTDLLGIFAGNSNIYGVNIWNFMGDTSRILNDSSGTPTTLRPAADIVKAYFTGGTITVPPTTGGDTTTPPATGGTTTSGKMLADFESSMSGV
jgi:hypothetical protein